MYFDFVFITRRISLKRKGRFYWGVRPTCNSVEEVQGQISGGSCWPDLQLRIGLLAPLPNRPRIDIDVALRAESQFAPVTPRICAANLPSALR
jgi:hypothetical protein